METASFKSDEDDSSEPDPRFKSPPPSNTSGLALDMTPLVHKMASQTPFTPDFHRMDEVYEQVCKDTQGYYVVGMSPLQFFEEFMPWQKSTKKKYKTRRPSAERLENLKSMTSARWEGEMYPKFVDALDGWVIEGQASGNHHTNAKKLLFLRSTAGDKDCNNLNIDISTYFEQELPKSCKFSLQQTQEEFKLHVSCDPFTHSKDAPSSGIIQEEEDTDEQSEEEGKEGTWSETAESCSKGTQTLVKKVKRGPGERDIEAANAVRGQIAAYAGVAMSMSPRTHLFSAIYLGKYARFIRWDRRGAIVTRRFDYECHPEYVFEFYSRFGQLSPRERGFDPTFKVFDEKLPEIALRAFEKYLKDVWDGGVPLEELLYSNKKTKKGPVNNRFYLVEAKDDKSGRSQTFLVPEPKFHVRFYNPFNRATRRSLAYPYKIGRTPATAIEDMCFIKDSWQEVSRRTPREAEIYRRLKKYGVEHVASMRIGGDVEGLETRTQDYFNDFDHANRFSSLGKMICHRIILETVARDLSAFGWTKVLLSCIADAVEACQQAHKAGILHRDISAGNVMITRDRDTSEWRGLLVDWDMCTLLDLDDVNNNISDPRSGRTGTWAFLSVNVLMNGGPHTLADDLESFLWVIIYISLRYLRHTFSSNIAVLSESFKALFSFSNDFCAAKLFRLNLCAQQASSSSISSFQPPEVNVLINELASVFNLRYSFNPQTNASVVNLNNPNDLWMSNILRKQAHAMAPMNITPTALKSPTNDSNPPSESALWQPADIEDAELEMAPNDIAAKTGLSPGAQTNAVKVFTLSFINHMDGISGHYHASWRQGGSASTSTSKRQNEVEGDHERKEKGKKRRQV